MRREDDLAATERPAEELAPFVIADLGVGRPHRVVGDLRPGSIQLVPVVVANLDLAPLIYEHSAAEAGARCVGVKGGGRGSALFFLDLRGRDETVYASL